jgi:hypothetical protein
MTTIQSEAHAFIVRIRKERGSATVGTPEWRGEVIHVPSQRTMMFQGLDQLIPTITRLLSEGAESR